MRLPRDLSGVRFAALLRRYGYEITRQTGSHMRLTSSLEGTQHHVTVPRHKALKPGTLNHILSGIASYLKMDKDNLVEELFGN